MDVNPIPFNKFFLTGKEQKYIQEAIESNHLCGNGKFTDECQAWLESKIKSSKALLTTSCTTALEMAAILANVDKDDEVIMPSYTFVSTANPFVLRGAVPVFVDIRPDTLNIDETKIEQEITKNTKAIVIVHYAGVGAQMDVITKIAQEYNLLLIEDNAQGLMSSFQGKPLGSFGELAALSFHHTKNIVCGEGGALLINNPRYIERAEIIWEKGTNRSKFLRREVELYTWVDIGSSYLPSELNAAFLYAQLEQAEKITQERLKLWQYYHTALEYLESAGKLTRPNIPTDCKHNGHIYYIFLESYAKRTEVIEKLKEKKISTVFHYIPLHSSPAGLKYSRCLRELKYTDDLSSRLLRLPLWMGMMTNSMIDRVVDALDKSLS